MSASQDITYPRPMTNDGQPDPLLRELTRDKPVLEVIDPGGGRAWLVAGYEAVREVLTDTTRFTSVIDPTVTDARARAGVSLVGMDPPEHTRLRRLAGRAFTARRIKGLIPDIEHVVTTLLDDMEKAGPPADLMTSLAVPLPLKVMCHMLRLPDEDEADFLRWSDVFTGMSNYSFENIADATEKLRAYMSRLASERRENLGEDVVSDLVRAHDGQDAMTEEELLSTMVLLLVAGHQTTIRAITRGVLILLSTGQWQRVVAGEVAMPQVVEEVLRHQAPTDGGLFRRATVDVELAGAQIKAGDTVFLSVHLANYDSSVWPQPQVFDPDRGEQGHLAFGHGVHFCLGAPLARAELGIALAGLVDRFPGLRLQLPVDELTWTVTSWLNAPVDLPVAW